MAHGPWLRRANGRAANGADHPGAYQEGARRRGSVRQAQGRRTRPRHRHHGRGWKRQARLRVPRWADHAEAGEDPGQAQAPARHAAASEALRPQRRTAERPRLRPQGAAGEGVEAAENTGWARRLKNVLLRLGAVRLPGLDELRSVRERPLSFETPPSAAPQDEV